MIRLIFAIQEQNLADLAHRLAQIPDTTTKSVSASKLELVSHLDFDDLLDQLKAVNIIDLLEV